jgi:hypothetical protein
MKVEYATVSIPSIYWINAHVINGSSGSMVVDEATGKVIGVVSGGHNPLAPGCEFDTEPQCKRERFSAPVNVALTPAWQAALHIP